MGCCKSDRKVCGLKDVSLKDGVFHPCSRMMTSAREVGSAS